MTIPSPFKTVVNQYGGSKQYIVQLPGGVLSEALQALLISAYTPTALLGDSNYITIYVSEAPMDQTGAIPGNYTSISTGDGAAWQADTSGVGDHLFSGRLYLTIEADGPTPSLDDVFEPKLPTGMTFDPVRYWELQPGSDVMATTLGVLPLVGTQGGQKVYAELVTYAGGTDLAALFEPNEDYWALLPVGTEMSLAGIAASEVAVNGALPGVYLGVFWGTLTGSPPLKFPSGWTPGNTTGSGPVLPYLGEAFGLDVYAGLALVAENAPPAADGWGRFDPTTPLTADGIANAPMDAVGSLRLAAYLVVEGSPAPTSFPEDWTFRPYGIGPVAITDENAGGVIGDIAYVVSGYVYNNQLDAFLLAVEPQYIGDLGLRPDGEYAVVTGDTFLVQGNYYRVDAGGVVQITNGARAGASAVVNTTPWPFYYWPHLERYNLRTKTWLPRIKLPEVVAAVAAVPGERETNPIVFESHDPFYVKGTPGAGDPASPIAGFSGMTFQDLGPWPGGVLHAAGSPPSGVSAWGFFVLASDANVTGTAIGYTSNDASTTGESVIPAGERLWSYSQRPGLGDTEDPNVEIFTALPLPDAWHVYAPGIEGRPAKYYAAEGGFAGVIDGKLYFGGGDGDAITGKEFFVYDPETEEFTRLADCAFYPDYQPYGVVNGKLWILARLGRDSGDPPGQMTTMYDPALNSWTDYLDAVNNVIVPDVGGSVGDQSQGVEIGGKLYFVYDRVYVFDPVALTVEAKDIAPVSNIPGAITQVEGQVHQLWTDGTTSTHSIYTPSTNAWSVADDLNVATSSYAVAVEYEGVIYVLSGIFDSPPGNNIAGVYGLTGNQSIEIPTTVPGGPVSTPDPHNHNNPVEGDGQFTGLYPDNNYPRVNGQLDIEQQKRLQARQESNRTPRGVLATDLSDVYGTPNETYPAHPPFTEHGPAALTANDFESDDPAYGPADSTSV